MMRFAHLNFAYTTMDWVELPIASIKFFHRERVSLRFASFLGITFRKN
jgi:hypothetical protein